MSKQKLSLRSLFVKFFTLFMSNLLLAQTGPGGVGDSSSNGLWLKADSFTSFGAVSSWFDSSGNGNDATQASSSKQPISFATSSINGMPIVRFDGVSGITNGDEMAVADAAILDGTSGITYFAVIRPNTLDTDPRGILGKRLSFTSSANYSYTWFFFNNDYLFLDVNTQNNRFSTSPVAFSNATNYLLSFTFDGSLTSSLRSKIYNEMDLIVTSTEASSTILSGTADLAIAALNVGYDRAYLGADYAEIIHYNYTVTEVERIIINNYLSAKYSISLSSNDFYDEDETAAGDFDFDVAGIGQAADGSSHSDSQGSGIIRINTPSSLGNDDYLFWGRNNRTSYTFSTNTSNYKERISSNWRVSKRNDLGTVTVQVDMTGIDLTGKQSCAPLQLVVDNDSDLLSPTTTYTLTNTTGDIYEATGVSFSDGDYFTVEYPDQIVVDNAQFYNGSGTSNVPNTSDDCFKLLVKNTADGSLPLTEDANVREVEIENGGKLVVNTNRRLQISNGINNSGEIRLLGDSQILQTHTGSNMNSGSGNLYQDQESITTSIYQSGYWSSPVTTNGSTFTIAGVLKDGTTPTSATSTPSDINFTNTSILDGSRTTPITLSGYWLARLTNASNWTISVSPTGETFNPGEGWNMKGPGGGTQNYTFVGRVNDGDYSLAIDDTRFSLIGNPYPSAVDADQFIMDNINAISGALYFWSPGNQTTHNSADYNGGYHTRVNGIGTPSGTTAISGTNFYIPVGQAFFVSRDVDNGAGTGTIGSSAMIDFTNSQRAFRTVSDSDSQFFGRTSGISVLRLGFKFDIDSTTEHQREVAIGFRGLTNNYENGYDAPMFDLQPSDMALRLDDRGTTPFVISGIEHFDPSIEIPLMVYLDQSREVTFNVNEKENFTADVFLKDTVTNRYYDISEIGTSFSIELKPGTYTDRFFVTFSDVPLSITEELLNQSKIYFDRSLKSIHVEFTDDVIVKSPELYNYMGQRIVKLHSDTLTSKLEVDVTHANPSVYILRIYTNKGYVHKKIMITP